MILFCLPTALSTNSDRNWRILWCHCGLMVEVDRVQHWLRNIFPSSALVARHFSVVGVGCATFFRRRRGNTSLTQQFLGEQRYNNLWRWRTIDTTIYDSCRAQGIDHTVVVGVSRGVGIAGSCMFGCSHFIAILSHKIRRQQNNRFNKRKRISMMPLNKELSFLIGLQTLLATCLHVFIVFWTFPQRIWLSLP